MKELILHIGTHKTGSTAIQLFLDRNRDVLLNKYNINYPLMENDRFPFQHSAVAQMIKNDESERLYDFLLNASKLSDTVLLSSESFSRANKAPAYLKYAARKFDKISIIVYLRRQDLWLESVYRQFAKVGKLNSPSTFSEWIDTFMINYEGLYSCDWLLLLNNWSNIFGRENICVRPYEKSQFLNASLVEDFLNSLQKPTEKKDFDFYAGYQNRSYNKSTTDFLQMMNNEHQKPEFRDLLRLLFPDPFADTGEVYLSFDKRMEIFENFENSNNEIARNYLKGDETKLFREPPPRKENYPHVFKGFDKKVLIQKIASLRKNLDNIEAKLKSGVK